MDKEVRAIKSELFKMCWYMRGGITIEQAYQMDGLDREVIIKIIEENVEMTNKMGMPLL